jgi:hypothetical protein
MKTNANNTARLEPSTHAADLAERVRMNQARKRALYYRVVTYQKKLAFTRRKDVWTCKRLAAEVEYFELDWQVLRKGNQVPLEIGASEVDAQKCTLERVTRCAA